MIRILYIEDKNIVDLIIYSDKKGGLYEKEYIKGNTIYINYDGFNGML